MPSTYQRAKPPSNAKRVRACRACRPTRSAGVDVVAAVEIAGPARRRRKRVLAADALGCGEDAADVERGAPRFSLACSVERRVSGLKPALDVAAPVRSARSSWCMPVSVSCAECVAPLADHRRVRAPVELGTDRDLDIAERTLAGEHGAERRIRVIDVDRRAVVRLAVEAEEVAFVAPVAVTDAIEGLDADARQVGFELCTVERDVIARELHPASDRRHHLVGDARRAVLPVQRIEPVLSPRCRRG